ncbi:SMP-30/gluconolactonase/LRE family protein [bacterium]|uniref:SMP-30/Gluconolaconase/LRE-like region-containing protein n=1 Tax=Rubinisphaera brasiliensis (strain ATCC 49424 / DSM 5305 / JCM 21570 / IAM 15109 / NBRC 103401 / IFAM 1448) TaxID=756272 RepID=F0SS93_RUBBR|nr:SMP-30/gluconolactonase/LRE family protein [Rubinisphaera brasiliensis]ADY58104.1 SMP-30/Gluconolaconase/LRE-like region-containing protein [Rubinisphaera brasiliensis DSM 5305]MBB01721.1 hypothetical protein [Planctomyces sp.]MBR9803224.1 SMP-30/gluconolactonase/LRE family protein [bacterium]
MPRSIVLSCLLTLVATGSAFAQDMPLSDVLIPGEGWELVSEGHKFTEGPAADADGLVYFVDVPNSKIFRIEADGQVTTVDENAERTSGLSFSSGGKLYACRNGGKKVVVYPDPKNDPAQVKVLAEDVTVNDLVADRAGGVYFTDPKNSRVVYVDPGQRLHVVAENLNPNGITLWSDYGTLVVTEGTEQWLWAFRVEPGGLLSGRGPYYSVVQIPSGEEKTRADGMAVDDDGRLYLASAAGLQVFDNTGRYSGTILKPQDAFLSNVIFGGPKFDTLYVTCQDKVYKRKVQPTGRPAWLPK